MKRNYLLLCQTTGDTNSVSAVAKKLKKEKQIPHILVLSKMAASLTMRNAKGIAHYTIDDLLPGFQSVSSAGKDEDIPKTFTEEQLKTLMLEINKKISGLAGVFSGVSSIKDSQLQRQLCQKFSEQFRHEDATPYGKREILVFNDYLFYDKDHDFFKGKFHRSAASTLLPHKHAEFHIDATLPAKYQGDKWAYDINIVQHPAYTQAIRTQNNIDQKKSDNLRNSLHLDGQKKLIFLAAPKEGYKEVLETVAEISAHFPNIQIRVGLHPAMLSDPDYKPFIEDVVSKASHMEMIPAKLNNEEIAYGFADGVIDRFTMGNTAALLGKQTLFWQEKEDTTAYVRNNSNVHFLEGKDKLSDSVSTFFRKVLAPPIPADSKDEDNDYAGLPTLAETAVKMFKQG